MPARLTRRQAVLGGAAFAGLAAASACSTPPPSEPAIPAIRFDAAPPIRLNVGAIGISDETPAPPVSPDWGKVFATLPRDAMRNWGEDRLTPAPVPAGGAAGTARFRIAEALVQHQPGEAVKGVFKAPRRETFTVRVAGVLEVPPQDGRAGGTASANAWGQESLEADTAPYARKLALDGLVRRVMAEFDREMERAVRANMAELLA